MSNEISGDGASLVCPRTELSSGEKKTHRILICVCQMDSPTVVQKFRFSGRFIRKNTKMEPCLKLVAEIEEAVIREDKNKSLHASPLKKPTDTSYKTARSELLEQRGGFQNKRWLVVL